MNKGNVLIVEDELLTANYIKSCIEDYGFSTSGIAVSYDEAIAILSSKEVDIVLLDINIFGEKTGIDIANEINNSYKIPFVFLTSYADKTTIEELQKTYPKGYLSKPINEVEVTTTLSIVLNNKRRLVSLTLGRKTLNIDISELVYISSEHVYLKFVFIDKQELVRATMQTVLDQFPPDTFKQINRSTAINQRKVIKKEGNIIYLQGGFEFKASEKFL